VPADPRRRSILAAAALAFPLLAAGCKGVGALGTPPRPLPDVAVLRDAITAEKMMIARYLAVVSGFPAQAGFLTPLLAQHNAHLARLKARLIEPRAPSQARSPSPPASPAPARSPSSGPAAIATLRAAEEDAASALVRHLAEVSPSLAQLLASIAASEASHALLLRSRGGAG
jgi:hypothetical protein